MSEPKWQISYRMRGKGLVEVSLMYRSGDGHLFRSVETVPQDTNMDDYISAKLEVARKEFDVKRKEAGLEASIFSAPQGE